MSFADLSEKERADFAICLGALLCKDAGVEASAETLTAIMTASNCTVPEHIVTLYANFVAKAGDLERFFGAPGAGGGGGGGGGGVAAGGDAGGAGGAAEAEAEPEPEEEPEEVDLGGGMDMFGGGDADY
uniref:60S acidic ribosomal protein P1 n=1 Tax=Pinguiococcus pyrenoidosus TaxID=172671 RepID=A0A7R9Y926_9STRA|mmetsp:Transcript_13640/g.50833  ORF Transcript_13640/g.50833 Transcript_13640/m.50833 type:complete len:129 (+) Transcript_13640:85-471(+)